MEDVEKVEKSAPESHDKDLMTTLYVRISRGSI